MSSSFPLVSVIVPTCNRQQYIGEAIDSILRQTYPNFEVIVVDDGSEDRTLEVLCSFGHALNVLPRSHSGIGATFNAGLAEARGMYIARLDDDDLWVSTCLQKQVENIQKNNLSASFGHTQNFFDEGLSEEVRMTSAISCDPMRGLILTCGVFQRKIFDQLGGLDERLDINHDMEWIGRMIAANHPFGYVEEVLHFRRIHQSNLSHSQSYGRYVEAARRVILQKRTESTLHK